MHKVRSRLIPTLAVMTGLLAVLVAGSPAAAAPAGGDQAQPEDAARAAVPTEGTASGGPIVRWVKAAGEFQRPSDEAVTAILKEFNARMAAKFAAGDGVLAPAGQEVEVLTLPNGLRRARVTADQLNVSLVRVAAGGGFANVCTDSPERAAELLRRPLATSGGGD
jgi:hypothetical protein